MTPVWRTAKRSRFVARYAVPDGSSAMMAPAVERMVRASLNVQPMTARTFDPLGAERITVTWDHRGVVAASLHTRRLDLAVPAPGDAEAIFTIGGDPATVAHNPSDFLADLAGARELVSRWIQHWHDRGFGYWCVREAGQSPVVGYCGMKAMRAHGQPVLNLIYRFRPSVWGRGYATEAAIAAVAWAEQHQPGSTILARVRSANKASQKVALKAGLRRDPAMDEQGEDGLDLAFTNRAGTTECRSS